MKKRLRFTNKSQSRRGIISSILGILSVFLIAGAFMAAYLNRGNAGKLVAIPGFLSLLFAFAGLYFGFCGMRDEDTYHLFPCLGCGINGVILTVFVLIYMLGW